MTKKITQKTMLVALAVVLIIVALAFVWWQTAPKTRGKIVEINMNAFQFGFDPAVIEVNKGDKVIIHLTNLDVAHGFALVEFGVNIPPILNKTSTAEFIADKAGKFWYTCNNPYCGEGHDTQLGKLIVKE